MKTDILEKLDNVLNKRGNLRNPLLLILEVKGILSSDEVDDILENDDKLIKEYLNK